MKNIEHNSTMGRPRKTPLGSCVKTVSIPREYEKKFKELGGSRWIAKQLEKELKKQ